jgi:hypothetical protein
MDEQIGTVCSLNSHYMNFSQDRKYETGEYLLLLLNYRQSDCKYEGTFT